MRVFGFLLVLIGALWMVICFVGTMMMSRSVNMFTEAFLPSLAGLVFVGLGLWMMIRKRAAR